MSSKNVSVKTGKGPAEGYISFRIVPPLSNPEGFAELLRSHNGVVENDRAQFEKPEKVRFFSYIQVVDDGLTIAKLNQASPIDAARAIGSLVEITQEGLGSLALDGQLVMGSTEE